MCPSIDAYCYFFRQNVETASGGTARAGPADEARALLAVP